MCSRILSTPSSFIAATCRCLVWRMRNFGRSPPNKEKRPSCWTPVPTQSCARSMPRTSEMADSREPSGMQFRMFLPATSANLGPAFDAAALAFDFGLRVEAIPAAEFTLDAHGRNVDQCGKMPGNLIVDTYTRLLEREGKRVIPLAIRLDNDIPLGMGCGSSAAAVLASVAMAASFGGLDWDGERIVSEASACEGHPDNVAACWHGGVVLARTGSSVRSEGVPKISVLPIPVAVDWPLLIAIPETPLAT